ncbi:MAG: rod shape-determining protein MreC [Betaproteobacteria bacterium]|nr:MAG: rod shape-determining protein MreC [Betaproteobacteria bacterium]TAG78297.1 MAG: rod shape-determining protein MreC [Betaproteobacteria bacterium]
MIAVVSISVTSLPKEPPRFFRRGPSAVARLTFFGLISIALMFIDARFRTLETIRMGIATVVHPLQQVALVPGELLDGASEFFDSRDKLRSENEQLKSQLLIAGQAAQSAVGATNESARLTALLGASQAAQTKAQISKVLYLGRDPFSQKIFIQRGTEQNFDAGSAVIDGSGLIGQLTRIHPLLAEVTLITEKDFAVPVKIERTGARMVLFGRGPGQFPELRFVTNNADVLEGDVLLTSNIDGVYPGNLRVAKIVRVARGADTVFSKIECAPLAGVNSAESVLVLDRPTALTPRPAAEAAATSDAKRRR